MYRSWSHLSFCLALLAAGASAQPGEVWIPDQKTSWQWQLSVPVDLTVQADVYDIDLFTNDAAVVGELHRLGRRAICYVSVGTWEPFRPDAGQFPAEVLGRRLSGFRNERWLDIRRLDVLGPIMEARLDLCREKGFDGVEPDNVDAYVNRHGFDEDLTYEDQLRYNRFIAGAAHERGLSVGLKNDLDQVEDLQPDFDWALNEQCFQYNECGAMQPFLDAGKAVFQVEYKLAPSEFCPRANEMGFNSLKKKRRLDAELTSCASFGAACLVAAVRNGASGADWPLSPGQIISVYGANLGSENLVVADPTEAGRYPVSLAGTQASVDGIPAPLLFSWSRQIGLIVPYGVRRGRSVPIVVLRDDVPSLEFDVEVSAAGPGVFTADSSGSGQAAALNQDETVNSPSNPAPRGSVVLIYATGEGETTPPGEDGALRGQPLPKPVLPVEVFIDGIRAHLEYWGAAPGYAGLMQINARVPESAVAGAAELLIRVGDADSQPGVTLAISE